jgi:hypothetical protein
MTGEAEHSFASNLIQQRVRNFSSTRADFCCAYRVTLLDKFLRAIFF